MFSSLNAVLSDISDDEDNNELLPQKQAPAKDEVIDITKYS